MKTENPEALAEALRVVESAVPEEMPADEMEFMKGKILWRLGQRAEAMTAYSRAVAFNADSPAAVALEQARDIMDYFNPELLNP